MKYNTIREGDKVKIVKKFGPIWVPSMDKTIGMTGVANQVSKRGSVRVGAWWYERNVR